MKKILLCDDNFDLIHIWSQIIFEDYGISCFCTENAKDAIKVLTSQTEIALIFCDYNMPFETGASVFNFNKDQANLPFFMMSANLASSFDGIKDLMVNPLNGVLLKPWSQNTIDEIINTIFLQKEHADLQMFA